MNGDVTQAREQPQDRQQVPGRQQPQEQALDQHRDQDLVDGVFRHVLADPEPVLPSTVDFAVLGGRRRVRRRRIALGAGTAALVVVAVFGAGALLGQHRQAAATTGVSRSHTATPSATRSPSAAPSPSATPSATPSANPTSANVQQTHPSTLGTDTSTGSPATSSAVGMMSTMDAGTASASPTASSSAVGNSNGTNGTAGSSPSP